MKLVKVENQARGQLLGFFVVSCGECVRVDPWNCYRFSPIKKVDGKEVNLADNPEAFAEEKERMLSKQKNNWRKLHLLPLVVVETYDELFEVMKNDKIHEEMTEELWLKKLDEWEAEDKAQEIDD